MEQQEFYQVLSYCILGTAYYLHWAVESQVINLFKFKEASNAYFLMNSRQDTGDFKIYLKIWLTIW